MTTATTNELLKYVPHNEVKAHKADGWIVRDTLANTHHGRHAIIMIKPEPVTPEKKRAALNPFDKKAGPGGRWWPRRKEALMFAIDAGTITREFALREYGLSAEELDEWRRKYEAFGLDGLRLRDESVRR